MTRRTNEHPLRPGRLRRPGTVMLVLLSLVAIAPAVLAADPPRPDFFWPYGRVALDGANVQPPVQPVIALVNGQACGEAVTKVAEAAPGVSTADVGATVYVVEVLADGQAEGQRSGCGRLGDPVMLYFPDSHRIAVQQPLFIVGPLRVDADLGPELSYRLQAPVVASDGTN